MQGSAFSVKVSRAPHDSMSMPGGQRTKAEKSSARADTLPRTRTIGVSGKVTSTRGWIEEERGRKEKRREEKEQMSDGR